MATLLRNEHQSTAFPRRTDIGIVKTVKSGYGVNPLAVSRRINDLEELNEMKIRARCPVFTNTEFVVEIMKARGNAGVREPSNRLDHVRSESPSFFTVKCSEHVLTLTLASFSEKLRLFYGICRSFFGSTRFGMTTKYMFVRYYGREEA